MPAYPRAISARWNVWLLLSNWGEPQHVFVFHVKYRVQTARAHTNIHGCAYRRNDFTQNSALHYFSRHLAAVKIARGENLGNPFEFLLAVHRCCVCVLKYIYMMNIRREREKEGEILSDHAQVRHYARAKESIWRSGGLTCVSVMRVKPVAFNVYRREMRRKTWRRSERASERCLFFSSTSVDLVFETSIAFSEESLMQTSSLWPVYDERKRERSYANSRNACIPFERKNSGWKYSRVSNSRLETFQEGLQLS